MFTAMDTDHDGFLTRTDFETLTARWITIRGDADPTRLREIMMGWWTTLSAAADRDHDDQVTLDEVLTVVDDLHTMLDVVALTAETMFEAADEDSDGQVSPAEYNRMIQAWTGHDTPTDVAFSRLDLDGDSWISRAEFVTHWVEFWAGDDEDAPGTYVFGEV